MNNLSFFPHFVYEARAHKSKNLTRILKNPKWNKGVLEFKIWSFGPFFRKLIIKSF